LLNHITGVKTPDANFVPVLLEPFELSLLMQASLTAKAEGSQAPKD